MFDVFKMMFDSLCILLFGHGVNINVFYKIVQTQNIGTKPTRGDSTE